MQKKFAKILEKKIMAYTKHVNVHIKKINSKKWSNVHIQTPLGKMQDKKTSTKAKERLKIHSNFQA